MTAPRLIELTEYQPKVLPAAELPPEVGQLLWRNYGRQVEVEFPNPKTEQQWRLNSQGWVGHIPLTSEFQLVLHPRVELSNLFGMLEYAYNLKSFHFLPGLVECQSLAEFYERLAHLLARRVLDRARQGFYRTYLAESDQLPYVRGRLEMRPSLQQPGQVKLQCHYEEHTADIAENQILAWTLQAIARGGKCTERVLPTVRRAYRSLQGLVTPQPFEAEACLERSYHRLNDDYRPLHALCYFFLAQSGPGHQLGEQKMLPFLVDMARLYERFVAEWLKMHVPNRFVVKSQVPVAIDQVSAFIDLVLYEADNRQPRWVLDTKYKVPNKPSNEDIYQVVAYARAKQCREAILIYPTVLPQPLDIRWADIRVRSLTFALSGSLAEAGQSFWQTLLASAEE